MVLANQIIRLLKLCISFESIFAFHIFLGLGAEYEIVYGFLKIKLKYLSLFALLVYGGISIYSNRRTQKSQEAIRCFGYITIFVVWSITSLLWTPSNGYGTDKALDMIIYILIPCLFCAVVIANSTVRIKRLLNILTIGTLVILIVSLPQFEEVARLNKQVTVFGSTYFGVGRFAGIGVVIALIGALRATSIFSVLSHVLFLLLSTLVLLLSGSRTPFFAIALLIPLVFIGSWNLPNLLRKAINRRILFASGLLVILVFGSLTLAPYLSSKGYYILTFHRILALKDNASAKIRYSWSKTVVQEMYISSALRKWTGYGLGSWPVSSIRPGQNYFRENYPYNIVFETFFELGILGLVLFMVLLSKLKVHLYWNQLRRDPYKFMIIALLIFFFINSLIFNDLPGNRVLFVMIVLTTAISDSIGS